MSEPCPTCRKPAEVCVCDRLERFELGLKIVVLQHPQEQDTVLGTVPLLEQGVGAVRRVGLSWPNLAAALGTEPAGRWAVVWPGQLPRALTPAEQALPVVRLDRAGGRPDEPLEGLLLLDGTWSQAKALWWRNPWLLKLDRIVIHPKEPSIYGKLRREPRKEWVSTLEAAADALVGLGEPESVRAGLRRGLRTLVQRARDAGRDATG